MRRYLVLIVMLLAFDDAHAVSKALIVVNTEVNHPEYRAKGVASPADTIYAKRIARDLNFSEIKVLFNATRDEFFNGMKWLSEGVSPGDKVMVYYSGMGARAKDLNHDEPPGDMLDEVIIMTDTSDKAFIIDDIFADSMRKIPARIKFAIFDCCFSKGGYKGIAVEEAKYMLLTLGSSDFDIEFFVPASAEYAPTPRHELAASPFTQFLFQAIVRNKADMDHDGIITWLELIRYTRKNWRGAVPESMSSNPTTLSCIDIKNIHNGIRFSQSCIDMNIFPYARYSPLLINVDKQVYREQEYINITVNMPFDGYLYILAIDADLKFKLLFPLFDTTNNFFRQGRVSITRFQATKPYGQTALIAIAARNKINALEMLRRDKATILRPYDIDRISAELQFNEAVKGTSILTVTD